MRPSFDCRQTGNQAERAICSTPELIRLDVALATAYRERLAGLTEGDAARERRRQTAWIAERNECRSQIACQRSAYERRLAEVRDASTSASRETIVQSASPPDPARPGNGSVLRDYPSDLAALRIVHWRGRPVVNHPSSTSARALFQLLAYAHQPQLMTGATETRGHSWLDPSTFSENAREIANTFLPPAAKPQYLQMAYGSVTANAGWLGTSEFETERSRQRFIEAYSEKLKQAAPKLPFEFVLISEQSLRPYDNVNSGFAIDDFAVPLLERQLFGWLTPRLETEASPIRLWPIPRDAAERQLKHLAATAPRGQNAARKVALLKIVEAVAVDPATLQLTLRLKTTEIYDPALQTRLHSFAATEAAPVSAQGGVERLKTPPAGIEPLQLRTLGGLPLFTAGSVGQLSNEGLRFFSLVALGSVPSHLDEYAAAVADLHLRGAQPFTQGQYRREGGLDRRWPGKDEFERRDSRKAFIDQYGEVLRRWAPRPPFRFAYAQTISLPDYDQKRNGFALPLPSLRGLDVAGLQTWESFAWPEPFLPRSQSGARKLLQDLRDAAPRDATGRSQVGERTAVLVATVEMAEIDPRNGRAELRLASLALYDSQLKAKLLDISTYDAPGDRASAPGRLPGPVALDSLFVGLQFLKKTPPDGTDPFWAGLGHLVQDRNTQLRNNPAVWGRLPANDPRRPYFGPLGDQMSQHDRAQFRQWAKAFAEALPQETVASFQTNITPAGHDPVTRQPQTIAAVQLPRTLNTAFDTRVLDGLGLQGDQMAVWEIGGRLAFIALPNRISLYTIDVPAAARDPQGYKAAEVRVHYQVERVDDGPLVNGRSTLLIRLVPRNAEVRAPGQQFALRSFDDIPRLDDSSFTAAPTPQPAARSNAPLALDANSLDLLTAAALGEQLSPGVMAQLVGRRWLAEDTGGAVPGGRFFTRGKRMPTLEEAAELAPRFTTWAKAVAPAFPARLTRTVPVTLRGDQQSGSGQSGSWANLNCFQGLTQAGAIWAAGLERTNAARALNRSSWTLAEERTHLTLTAATRLKDFMAPVGGQCAASRQPYTVPQLFGTHVSFAGTLPEPALRFGPSGQQQLTLSVMIEVDAPQLQQDEPIFTDLLPRDLPTPESLRQNRRKGEFTLFQSRLVEASYRHQSGGEAGRYIREGPVTVAAILQSLRDELAKVVPPSAAGKPYGPDIVGVRLGMSFAEAEAAIRAHMPVGRVLDGKRASDEAVGAGVNEPITSGKLFISENGMELIALIDEPPAASQRVLAVWRRVHSPSGQIRAPEMYAGLLAKYGPLPDRQQFDGGRALWYDRATAHCTANYRYGQRQPLAAFWYEDGAPTQWQAPGARPAEAAILPPHFRDPTSQESLRYGSCGAMLTAQLNLDTVAAVNSYYRYEPIDLLEMSLSDFGAYQKAFIESRKQLQAAAQGGGNRKPEFAEPFGPDMVGLRLGQSLQEAEAAIRTHMDVGRVFEADAGTMAGRPPLPFAGGKLFISRDERELIALHPGPAAANGRLAAAWRRIYVPAATALDAAAGPMQAKYGEPAFRSIGGDVVVWGQTRMPACNDAYVAAIEATRPLDERWRENGAPAQWRPPTGEAPGSLPALVGRAANGEPWLENCGPRLSLQFRAAQGAQALSVIETTLTDLGRYRRALDAERPAALPGRVKL
ncbi:hypothetical protein [Bosea sp. BK604]|uniref:hypothetical protein n=1 Tax=Bosea sp. BK604 TaxID=2512180 RepID=UPI00104C5A9A|nr:hypothetical protein [Bosea sp. BK604]TCR67378.1 hypothetical protein EV560_103438 [Bosea sp. BK604]